MNPFLAASSVETDVARCPNSAPSTPPDAPSPDSISPPPLPSPSPPASPNKRPQSPLPTQRRRKKARVFEIVEPAFQRKVTTVATIVQGAGIQLSAIPNIMYSMDKCKAKDPQIEFLHRLLFNCPGHHSKRKANIRQFSGFVFASNKDRTRVRDKLRRAHFNIVRKVCALLDVPLQIGREQIMDSIMTFLDAPKLLDGRCDLAQRDKQLRMEKLRKKAEKARALKMALQKKKQESDEDGDEDLEFAAKPWIVLAKEQQIEKQLASETSSHDDFGEVEEEVLAGEGRVSGQLDY